MVNHKEINSRDLENVNTLKDLNEKFLIPYKLKEIKPPGEEGYFIKNGIIDKSAYTDLPINNLIPSVDNLEKEVLRAYGEVLIKYAWIMSNYRPNYIILAGRTSSLPVISRILKEYITIPPSNIISLKDYFIGSWHPFSKNGIVNDPKTSVVVGNAITDLSMDKEMKDVNISTDGDHSDYTLNFIGVNQAGNRLSDDQIIYQSGEMIEDKQYLMNELNVIFRNMDDANMPCNLMYTLKLKEGIMTDEDPIGVRFEFVESEKGLKISSVSGDVINRKDNQKREATNDDVILKQKTLYDSEYWLDNGKFGVID